MPNFRQKYNYNKNNQQKKETMFTRDAMIKGIAKATAKDKAKKNQQKKTMNKVNIIASIVEGETLCDFGLLMEDTDFKNLLKAVINLPIEEATSQLINKANEIS